ncbi:hypothetical protein HYV43_06450 [Candidatus Micrarchaeota archaeon]|nr:hypothetical protein [Candidatus Micrarchaeota archaeon]
MKLSYLLVGIGLLLAAVLANAFTLYVSEDAVHTAGTQAVVYAYASERVAFSVQSEYVNARVENLGDHAQIHLLAPDCLQGTQTITIRATNGTSSQEKRITLTNQPRQSCSSYIQPTPLTDAFFVPKSLTFSHTYDATHYDLDVDAGTACTNVVVGQTVQQKVRLSNQGAAVTVRLRPAEDESATHTYLAREEFVLDRNELKSSVAYIRALKPGVHYVALEALRGDIVIGRASACVNAADVYHATLTVPTRIDASACQLTSVPVQVRNDGTAPQTFVIQGDGLTPQSLFVPAGQTAQADVQLDASGLRPNENVVAVTAKGQNTAGTAFMIVNVIPCAAQIVTTPVSISPETLVWTVRVDNGQDTPLRNVTLSVSGIPTSWTQVSDAVDIPPHSSADLTVRVTRTTDEGANPVIHVLADGREIAQHAVAPIAPRSSITGRVIGAISDNLFFILAALLLVVAALWFLGAGSNRERQAAAVQPVDTGSTDQNTEIYKGQVRSVKVKVESNTKTETKPDGNGRNRH